MPQPILTGRTPPFAITDLPPLIVGGAVFNTQYVDDPTKLPIKELIGTAFTNGLNAIDTSPYYGPSEELIGDALAKLSDVWPRELYFICTKAGRIKLNDFDYSRALVRSSVLRSLKRLNTSYLDLVYMHDIEFVTEDEVYDALRELVLLKQEGVVKNIGVSGYPVEFLLKVARGCQANDIGPLDAVMSYSNGCLQNTRYFDLYEAFCACGVKKLMNGSILSMSLLRSGVTHSFHPALEKLRAKSSEVAQALLTEDGVEMADLATRFAFKKWLFDTAAQDAEQLVWNERCSVVLGVSSQSELAAAVDGYRQVQSNEKSEEALYAKAKARFGEHFNETWESGIEH